MNKFYHKYTFFAFMKFRNVYTLIAAIILAACQTVDKTANFSHLSNAEVQHLADSLAQTYIIVDTHVDLPYRLSIKNFRLEREYLGIPVSTTEGDFRSEERRVGKEC